MADEYDGRVTIGTEMDLSGFEKGSEKLKTSVSGLVNAINGIAQTMEQAFGKHWKMPEPDLPEPEEMELTQPEPIKPEVDTSDFDAGTKKIHEDMERIIRDVGSDLPEPKPIEPELDSEEFDDQARRMQTSISRVVREIDRMVSTSAQGFQSTASVLAFNNKLDLTSEKIAEAREQLALFASQQIPTDQYAETTKSIEKAENALLKLYDRRDQLSDLGASEDSKQWQRLALQIQAAEEEVERYEMAADRMRETGLAFVDTAATEQYAEMVAQIEQAERDIQTNIDLIRQQEIAQKSLNVQIAQEKVANAGNIISRQIALRQLRSAQNALAYTASKSVTPAPDPSAGSAWGRFAQTIRKVASGVSSASSALRNLGVKAAKKAISGVNKLSTKLLSFFSNLNKKGGGGVDNLFKKFTGLKNMLMSRIKRTFISFLFEQVKESFNELAKFDARFDKSVSNLRNRTSELGANIMASLGGIIRQIEPIITKAVDAASAAVAKINAVMSAIRGEATMQIAVRRTESYADSLRDAAKSAKEAQKAQEKLNATLTSIDEIHKLDAPAETVENIEANTDAEKVIYQNVPVDSILNNMSELGKNIASRIVEGIKNGKWSDAGHAISEGLNTIVSTIDERILGAREAVKQKARDIADLLNGMVDGFNATALGQTIGDGINLALDTAYTFLERFDFSKFGVRTVEGLNGLVERFDPEALGRTIGSALNGAIDWAYEVFTGFEWDKFGEKLGTNLNAFIKKVKWDKAAKTLSAGIAGIFNSIASFLETADWESIGESIVDFFKNIDWGSVASALFRAIGAAIGGIAGLMKGIFNSLIDTGEKWGEKLFERYGDELNAAGDSIGAGILAGLKAVFKDIKNWIKTNIVKPFTDGFKKAFRIGSPSKEMKPYGGYVGEGILEGIKDAFSDITQWVKAHIFEPFKKGFATAFNIVGGAANSLLESGKSIASGLKNGIDKGWNTITTLFSKKNDEMRAASTGLADSAASGFNDTEKFSKAGKTAANAVETALKGGNYTEAGKAVVEGVGKGIDDNYGSTIGDAVNKARWEAAKGFTADDISKEYYGAGKHIDTKIGNAIAPSGEYYSTIGEAVRLARDEVVFGFKDADYYGAGAYAASMFSAGIRENYATAISLFEGVDPTEWNTAMLQAFYGVQQAEKSWNDTNIRTADSLRTIKTVAAEVVSEAEELNGKEIQIDVSGAASKLDHVADKLSAIAQTFRDIGSMFDRLSNIPVPAVAMGAITPAQTRVLDYGDRNDGVSANLIERLITRIEELEEAVANRPIRLESKVMINQREIGKATADYNAGNNRVTNGNGGAINW